MVQEWNHARGILVLLRKQDSGFLGFFKNTEMFLACAFVPLPGAVGRSEFSLGYLLQLDAVTGLYASMESMLLPAYVRLDCFLLIRISWSLDKQFRCGHVEI